jgi:hypothetical protein
MRITNSRIGGAVLGVEQQDVAHQPHDVLLALARRDVAFDAVCEEQQPDLVVVGHRRERQRRGHLCGLLHLELRARAEVARSRRVDAQDHRQLALLDELLDVGAVHACRDLPVDRADVVARQVLADVDELHALALERRAVLAHERRVDDLTGAELDLSQLLEELER